MLTIAESSVVAKNFEHVGCSRYVARQQLPLFYIEAGLGKLVDAMHSLFESPGT